MKHESISRRSLLAATSVATFPYISTRNILGANSKLNIAAIGAGGKGKVDIDHCSALGQNVVALCDVDSKRAAGSFQKYSRAKRFKDFRQMFDTMSDQIDAVTISTPDHTHFHPAYRAMKEGKAVYLQKPLTHTIEEARILQRVAAETGVVTQMGNQGHSEPNSRRLVELIRAGVLGDVTEIHTWTDRPFWPQGNQRPKGKLSTPSTLDWQQWLGPAPDRPYHSGYAPFKWRGWWDFGTGSLGDMACHNMDMIFWALDLQPPLSVESNGTSTSESPPSSCTITWHFPNPNGADPIKMVWYDGKRKPKASLAGRSSINSSNGSIIIGTEDRLYIPYCWGPGYFKSSASMAGYAKEIDQTIPRIQGADRDHDKAHHMEWIQACLGEGKALSHFDYAAPLTETILLGNVALRCGEKIEWNDSAMMVTNLSEANQFVRKPYREGWELPSSF